MKVFLSWSGNVSHQVALVFRDWLPSVIQAIQPYVSSEDIDKGARWSTDIAEELQDSSYGILCITKENINEPWLNFEAGALSKTIDSSFVSPFLYDIKRSEVNGPILQFQSTILDKEDIKKLILTLNDKCEDNSLSEQRLSNAFEVWYPILLEEMDKIEPATEVVEDDKDIKHDSFKILEEVLELARMNQKILRTTENANSEKLVGLIERLEQLYIESSFEREDCFEIEYKRKREMLMHNSAKRKTSALLGLQVFLSWCKQDIPIIYDIGNDIIRSIENGHIEAAEKKLEKIKELMKLSIYFENERTMRMRTIRNKRHLHFTEEIISDVYYAFQEILDR